MPARCKQRSCRLDCMRSGPINYSYPFGPVNYSAAPKKAPYGVGYWRPEYYVSSCKCWHIPNPTWNPPFK